MTSSTWANILHENISRANEGGLYDAVRIENYSSFTSAIHTGVEAGKIMLDDVDFLTKCILSM